MPVGGPEHRQAMQDGRNMAITVRKYLAALNGETTHRPQRDNTKALEKLKSELAIVTNPLQRIKLLQRQYNLVHGEPETEQIIDLAAAEREFVEIAKPYSEKQGIVREVWLEVGIPGPVLDQVGI